MKTFSLSALFFVGTFTSVFAQQGQVNGSWLLSIINLAQTVVNSLSPILITVALLAFFWFLIQFIWKGGESPSAHANGMKGMGYSILALFVMVSIWGIIQVLQNIFGVPTITNQPDVPTLPPSMRNQ
ncbi:hypothetical protein K9M47_00200 [Candidatus Gracilibacteria bacterium]|nr:hypothetical protein [Candidatus Gracilibacteria bacterium]